MLTFPIEFDRMFSNLKQFVENRENKKMGSIVTIIQLIDFCCPHCNFEFELDDLDVSVTIDHVDISRHKDDGVFTYTCENCHKDMKITCQMDIAVCKN